MSTRFRLGYAHIDSVSREQALAWVLDAAKASPCRFVVTPNSDHLVMLETHLALQAVYQKAHLVVADGMPLVWASRLLGSPLPERVTGSELMPLICAAAPASELRIFLLGAGPGVALQAKANLEAQYPGLQIVGTYSPPFGFELDPALCETVLATVKAASPHIVFVGLGAPKQEIWMLQNFNKLDRGVLLGIGAGIDFCAGHVKRAPLWLQRSGFEWLFRLSQEPRRLARRYMRDTLIFWIVLREFLRRFQH